MARSCDCLVTHRLTELSLLYGALIVTTLHKRTDTEDREMFRSTSALLANALCHVQWLRRRPCNVEIFQNANSFSHSGYLCLKKDRINQVP